MLGSKTLIRGTKKRKGEGKLRFFYAGVAWTSLSSGFFEDGSSRRIENGVYMICACAVNRVDRSVFLMGTCLPLLSITEILQGGSRGADSDKIGRASCRERENISQ